MPPTITRITSSLRIPALDGLRGIAILLVLLWHSLFRNQFVHYPALNRALGIGFFSWSGVDLFFVLSGFLIGGILLDHQKSPRYFQTFYLRRAYRILPLYFVLLTLCWLAEQFALNGWTPIAAFDLFPGRIPWWTFFLFLQNIGMAATGGFGRAGLAVTWSLAIEEQFYLTLPLVIRRIAPKHLVYLLAAVSAAALLLRAWLIHFGPTGAFAAYVLTPCRADALALGVLCALCARSESAWRSLTTHRPWLYAALAALGLALLLLFSQGYLFYDRTLYGLDFTILALFYSAALLIAITGQDPFVRWILCNPWLRKLGGVAYGTYLFHYLCIDLFQFLVIRYIPQPSALSIVGAQLLGVTAAIALATLSWRYFEKPLVHRAHAYDY